MVNGMSTVPGGPSPTRKERRAAAREARLQAEEAVRARNRRNRRLLQLAAVVAVAAVIVGVLIATTGGSDKTPSKPAASTNALLAGIPQNGSVLGDPKAPVRLTEYADLQCPVCRSFASGVVPTLVRDYVSTGKVKMDYRNWPILGQDSVRAAEVALAVARQDKMWQFTERFYADQQPENTGYVTDGFLRKVAGEVPGLDVDKAMRDRFDPAIRAKLLEIDAQARKAGATGTPTVLVGRSGRPARRIDYTAIEPSQFTGPIDAALGK
jgi:protein-disulfide isomerase